MPLHIVILAAGQGKRMHSKTPKVLHHIGGKPLLQHVIDTASLLNPTQIHVIIGHGGAQIKEALSDYPVHWVLQTEQLGTGHAVMQALPHIPDTSHVLVLSADVPLIQLETLQSLVHQCQSQNEAAQPLGLLLARVTNATGLGRILRDQQDHVVAIIEEKDANDSQRQIHEIYSGICCTTSNNLRRWLPTLNNHNAQKEYYLTAIISLAVDENLPIISIQAPNELEIQGINNRQQLQQAERAWQHRMATQLMLNGVTLADAARIDVRGELTCGQDVFIDANTIFQGTVTLGNHCHIAANCHLSNVILGDHCQIHPNSVLEHCQLGDHCEIGPFARLRPGTQLAAHCKIGNFVETKQAIFDQGTKANHLSYLGDVNIGKHVNIGAGTITCNYDGAHKHLTTIEDGAFIGSDTQLVAPVTIGKNATIGAGSTIRKDAPPNELTLTESKQKTISGWRRPQK